MRLDREWRVVYVNAEAERLNQLPRSEMLGKTLWELFPAVVGTKLEAEYRRCVAEQLTANTRTTTSRGIGGTPSSATHR